MIFSATAKLTNPNRSRRKHAGAIILALAASAAWSAPVAAKDRRTARIVDSKGNTTLVSDLVLGWPERNVMRNAFDPAAQTLILETGIFKLGIPVNSLTALLIKDAKDQSFEVKYRFRGEDLTLTGRIDYENKFFGKSDLGDFSISLDKVNELSFPAPSGRAAAARDPERGWGRCARRAG